MQVNKAIVGLNSWIIQDGNYGDFRVGESYNLALEFNGPALMLSSTRLRQCKRRHASYYNVIAEVIFATPEVWVIDFGIKVFCEAMPPRFVSSGDWVEGEIWIGVDPFFYKDRLHRIAGMPDLFTDWLVTRVQLETTPWVEDASEGRMRLMRNIEHDSWVDKEATDAWTDDEGRGDYLLSLSKSATI
ncbi:hypothetical protein [Paraburkholderia atlantica]|uniref:hypothetical protein n=1 Tax=Paraburkholderia atlantica TaxID=2654982 RepID=UPI0016221698|nr:hypothetical protein [Paraburkholderia atlantica]MBB5510841.1 hypothetical protein [Paraburkholderia atlantica]